VGGEQEEDTTRKTRKERVPRSEKERKGIKKYSHLIILNEVLKGRFHFCQVHRELPRIIYRRLQSKY
jgi:hypothetical protein